MRESEPDDVMTVDDVSQYLRLGKSTIYKLAKSGDLPGRKIGGRWRFSQQVLSEWLTSRSTDQRTVTHYEETS